MTHDAVEPRTPENPTFGTRQCSVKPRTSEIAAFEARHAVRSSASAELVVGPAADGISEVSIEPAPMEGVEVVLNQSCDLAVDEDACIAEGDIVERARFVIGPRDAVAPPPPDDVVVEHEIGMFAADCGSPETSALVVVLRRARRTA